MDSSLSASELRKRYTKGGSLPDSELTAAQLRARAGLTSNARDWSTRDNPSSGAPPLVFILAALIVITLMVLYLGGFFG